MAGDLFAGRYRVIRLLRDDRLSVLHEAVRAEAGGRRLLQRMPPSEAPASRYVAEALKWARAAGEHGTELVEDGVEGDVPWLVWDLPDGETLLERIERDGPLPHEEASVAIGDVGRALAKLHYGGVIHGDLRPEGVLLAHASAIVPMRSWLSGHVVADRLLAGTRDAALGSAVDLWSWAAPEEVDGGAVHPTTATDVWAFALLAFYALTGERYWKSSTSAELAREILADPMPPASERAAERGAAGRLPAGFDGWFAACAARDRSARIGDMVVAVRAFSALFDVRSSEPILANPKGSFYDEGLQEPPPSQPAGSGSVYRGGQYGRPETRGPQLVVLANPKGSYYDRGLAREPRRWPAVIAAVLLFVVAPAILILRACQR